MKPAEKYDVVVLGSGTAGKLMAWTMAKEGRRTAVIERKYIGGSCPNIACLPSKNVIHSAKVASLVARHREFGIETGPIAIDMKGVYARKRDMVDGIVKVHLDKYHASGAEIVCGDGVFVAPRTLQVALRDGGERTFTADRVFVNLGSRATIPDIPGLREAKPMTPYGQNSRNTLKIIRLSIWRRQTSGSRHSCVVCDSEYRLRSRNIVDRFTIPATRPEPSRSLSP